MSNQEILTDADFDIDINEKKEVTKKKKIHIVIQQTI